MAKGTHHVVPDRAGGWNVRKGGSDRSSGHYDTKDGAIRNAREMSRNQHTELYIHDRHGRIVQKDSHGGDPHPPKG